MNQRIKTLALRFAKMSFPARLLLSLVFALLGSLSVGSLSEYAGYYYAISEGFRPPFEGVPYLKPAVSLVAFLFFTGLAIVVSILYLLASLPVQLAKEASEKGVEEAVTRLRSNYGEFHPVQKFLLIPFNVFVYRWTMGADFREARRLYKDGKNEEALISINTEIFGTFIYRPTSPYFISAIGGAVFIMMSVFYLFDPPSYRNLLCLMRYGGGHPVVVELLAHDSSNMKAIEGGLAIRTTSAVILEISDSFVEIPIEHIESIQYPEWPQCFL